MNVKKHVLVTKQNSSLGAIARTSCLFVAVSLAASPVAFADLTDAVDLTATPVGNAEGILDEPLPDLGMTTMIAAPGVEPDARLVEDLKASAPTDAALPDAGMASSAKKGMTWKKRDHYGHGEDYVWCNGCNAYTGDTLCSTKLPILCLKTDGSPDPGVYVPPTCGGSMPCKYYFGWAEGHIGLTFPVPGDALKGLQDANDVCEAQFGPGYKMAEHHDGDPDGNNAGWGFYAYGNINDSSRFWVSINDQPSNCWGRGNGTHSGWTYEQIKDLLLCGNPDGCGTSSGCTEEELKVTYDDGFDDGFASCPDCPPNGNCPNPTYQFDSSNNTGILKLPSIDIQLLNPLYPVWSTQHDAFSAVMELIPGTTYFRILEAKPKPVRKETPATDQPVSDL